jgi:hypothetical protein
MVHATVVLSALVAVSGPSLVKSVPEPAGKQLELGAPVPVLPPSSLPAPPSSPVPGLPSPPAPPESSPEGPELLPELDPEPELDVPELEAPELEAPELEAPELDAPELEAPELDVPLITPELDPVPLPALGLLPLAHAPRRATDGASKYRKPIEPIRTTVIGGTSNRASSAMPRSQRQQAFQPSFCSFAANLSSGTLSCIRRDQVPSGATRY